MNQLDVYYRALLEHRKLTDSNIECESLLRSIAMSDSHSDSIVVVRNVCTIDDEWVSAIEEGLVHIEKAIKEERQFILSKGEVVPIEKAKHISKDSVIHLAKHSNLITREQDGEDIVPDYIYTVERLNDYSVYENRFLYMLLCYLRDFVSIRYEKIVELTNKYNGSLNVHKEVIHGKRRLVCSIELSEERRDDDYLRENNDSKEIIDRISLILKTILAFLATPLMEGTAKAPMLKPPITKTNVLKMDKHFKGAVALYDYIMAYDKQGYEIEEKKTVMCPPDREAALEIADICAALSFVTYKNGLDISDDLEREYERDEERRKNEELIAHSAKLETLKKRLARSEVPTEEYILSLEAQMHRIDGAYSRMEDLLERFDVSEKQNRSLRGEITSLDKTINELSNQIEDLSNTHLEEIETTRGECNARIAENEQKLADELVDIKKKYSDELNGANKDFRARAAELNARLNEIENEKRLLEESYSELEKEKRLAEAKLKAFMAEKGMMTGDEDFSSQRSFDELEREYAAFTRFYNSQWKKAKKEIRRNLLNLKSLKSHNENNDEE